MRTLLIAFSLMLALAAQGQIEWSTWDAAAIPVSRTTPLRFDIQFGASSGVTAARLDLVSGDAIQLIPLGDGRFTCTITPAQALVGYDDSDVHRNFAGYLRLLDTNGQLLATYNQFINVLDANVPATSVQEIAPGARQSPRIVNLHHPRSLPLADAVKQAVRDFYRHYPDEFDFVQVVFTLPSLSGNRYHISTRNAVEAIGMPLFDQNADYGGPDLLSGVNVYPLDGFFDCAELGFSHETGHQWMAFFDHPRFAAVAPHWPPSNMAAGVMGFNLPGSPVGGAFGWSVTAAEPGFATVQSRSTERDTFTDFDLYAMGLLAPEEVKPAILLDGPACANCRVAATIVTIDDIIDIQGPRKPSAAQSKKHFRVATILVSRDRLLTDEELAFFETFAARGESQVPLPYTAGFGRGMTNPWFLATRGLSTVDFRLQIPPASPTKRRAARH